MYRTPRLASTLYRRRICNAQTTKTTKNYTTTTCGIETSPNVLRTAAWGQLPSARSLGAAVQRRGFAQERGPGQKKARGIPDFDLSGKVVVVSGGAGGLGLAQAEALLEAGAIVYALDRRQDPPPAFAAIADRAKLDWDTQLEYRQVDVRDNFGLNAIIENIGNAHRRVDGLIAAAGIQQEGPALDYTQEDVNAMFEINVTGVFMTAQAVARQMVKYGNGGSIALVGSMSAYGANRDLRCAAYNPSKAAILQLARNFASEWGEHNIRVNSISPGYIVTPMVDALFEEYPERKETWPKENMLGRLSKPQDFRGVGVFLMSDGSSFMTGSDIRIDGGHMAW